MHCTNCEQAGATIHVLERSSDDPASGHGYCADCYGRLFPDPPRGRIVAFDPPWPVDPPLRFPRPRFRIRHLMILAGVFGLLNAAIVLGMRNFSDAGTPAEHEAWTVRALVFANVFCAIMAAEVLAMLWLVRWYHYLGTGRWVPLKSMRAESGWHQVNGPPIGSPGDRMSLGEFGFMVLALLWIFFCVYLIQSGTTAGWFPGYRLESLFAIFPVMYGGAVLAWAGVVAMARRRAIRDVGRRSPGTSMKEHCVS